MSQARDPHRGLTVIHFLEFTPQSVNAGYPRVSPTFSVLGTDKEDSLLSYARDNHITYLELYDLYRVFRYNDSAGTVLPNGLSLVEGLCEFINKARNQYCITEIGAAGENEDFFNLADSLNHSNPWLSPGINLTQAESQSFSSGSSLFNLITSSFMSNDSLFVLSEQLKYMFKLLRFNAVCTSHFDFYNVVDEYWAGPNSGNPNYYGSTFVPLMQHVDQLKQLSNFNGDSIRVAAYIRAINSTFVSAWQNQRDDSSAYLLDGNGTSLPLTDRLIAVHYEQSDSTQYKKDDWRSQLELFKRPLTRNKTDYHPYFSTETAISTGYQDFLGPWLRDKYHNNIFEAETEFYRRWRADPNTNINSVHENNIRPGGFHYFASHFMIDSLKSPRIFTSNSPICTNGTLGDSLRISYMGPREDSIFYTLNIHDGSTLFTQTGFTGAADSLLNNVTFSPVYLDTLYNPVIVSLRLDYSSTCSYTFTDSVYVRSAPHIQAMGPISFCQGNRVTLVASSGTSYSWRRIGNSIVLGTSKEFTVSDSGSYYCIITGGNCAGTSNQITVNVISSPLISIYADCINTDTLIMSVVPTPGPGATYRWSTNRTGTSDTITTPGGYKYYVLVTDSNGCMQQAQKNLSLPAHIPQPNILCLDSLYCQYQPGLNQLSFNPQDFATNAGYKWTANGISTPTYGLFNTAPFSETTTVYLEETSASGCSNIGYDSLTIEVFHCCLNQDSTAFYADSSSKYGSGWSGKTVNVRGDFYIDSNFDISNTTLNIDSTATIFILANRTLTISNSVLQACNSTWNGIVLSDPSAKLYILDSSTVKDAITGVTASNDALVEIHNSTFVQNGTGILVRNGSFSNFIVNGSTFSGIGSFSQRVGVSLENASNVTIGDAGFGSNTFSDLYVGIYSYESNLNVRNCLFMNNSKPTIPNTMDGNDGQGSGILAMGDLGSIYQLNVGGSVAEACFFNDNTNGIYMKINIELYAANNVFNNIGYINQFTSYGIYDLSSLGAMQNISDNIFNRLDYGVWLANVHDAEIYINNNLFNDFMNVPVRQSERAITVWSTNPFGNASTRTVRNNIIRHHKQGISLTHQQGIAVEENEILFDLVNPTSVWYGIRVMGGTENIIRLNNMNRIGTAPDLGLSRLVYGISIDRSENNLIAENEIFNLGTGIRFFATTVSNTIKCNQLIQSVDNLVMENALIGDQGSPSSASDNFWLINPNTEQTQSGHGNILNIGNAPNPRPIFYVQDLPGFNPDYLGVGDCPYVCPFSAANIDNNANPSNSCSSTTCNDPFCYQDLIAQIIDEQAQFAGLPDEQNEEARNYAFELLIRDSMLMYQGTILDAKLRDFYIEMKEGNSGIFEEITNLLQEEDNQTAIIINSTITPENLSESNLQLFNEQFLSSWAENNFELDGYTTSILEFIAYQNPYSGGDAVYCARVMLGLDLADFIAVPSERRSSDIMESTNLDHGIIVPNPNSGKMSYIYTMSPDENSEFQVYNSRGRLIKTYKLNPEGKFLEIDLGDQSSGIYVYRVITNGKVFAGNKIILQK